MKRDIENKMNTFWETLPVVERERGIPQHLWNKHQRNEANIQRYCSCGWATVAGDEANSRALTFLNPNCKLHGEDVTFDLPEGI